MNNAGFLGSGVSLVDGLERVDLAISDVNRIPAALKVLDAWSIKLLAVPTAHDTLSQLLHLRDLLANLSAGVDTSRTHEQADARRRVERLRRQLSELPV